MQWTTCLHGIVGTLPTPVFVIRSKAFAVLPVLSRLLFVHRLNCSRSKVMWRDPIVEEIHKVRDEYAKQFNYDLAAICRDLQERQRKGNRKIVSFERQPPETVVANKSLGDANTAHLDVEDISDHPTQNLHNCMGPKRDVHSTDR
jgi:hypothetical protein